MHIQTLFFKREKYHKKQYKCYFTTCLFNGPQITFQLITAFYSHHIIYLTISLLTDVLACSMFVFNCRATINIFAIVSIKFIQGGLLRKKGKYISHFDRYCQTAPQNDGIDLIALPTAQKSSPESYKTGCYRFFKICANLGIKHMVFHYFSKFALFFPNLFGLFILFRKTSALPYFSFFNKVRLISYLQKFFIYYEYQDFLIDIANIFSKPPFINAALQHIDLF